MRPWLRRFRQGGVATARQLLALWCWLLNNFNLDKVGCAISDGTSPGVATHEAGDISGSNLHGPYRRLPFSLDNFRRVSVSHKGDGAERDTGADLG
jgi:hypothetical protein